MSDEILDGDAPLEEEALSQEAELIRNTLLRNGQALLQASAQYLLQSMRTQALRQSQSRHPVRIRQRISHSHSQT